MIISEMNTDRALDFLVEITPYVADIVTDEKLVEVIKKKVVVEKGGAKEVVAEKAKTLVPVFLRDKRDDVYGILSALEGIPVEEIARQNILKTASMLMKVFKDKELIDFFQSFVQSEGSE